MAYSVKTGPFPEPPENLRRWSKVLGLAGAGSRIGCLDRRHGDCSTCPRRFGDHRLGLYDRIVADWPANSFVILGVLLGLDLAFWGAAWIGFGWRLRRYRTGDAAAARAMGNEMRRLEMRRFRRGFANRPDCSHRGKKFPRGFRARQKVHDGKMGLHFR